jgi:hypothetical protein
MVRDLEAKGALMEARFEAQETDFGGNGSSHPAARAAHCRLPMLDGAQGDRYSRGIREGARNCDKSRSASVAKLHPRQAYRSQSGYRKRHWALRRQRPMIRVYSAIIAAVINTITYSIVLFG